MGKLLLGIGVVLFVLWALGFITSYYLGGYVHILLAIAIICVVVWLVMYILERHK